MSVVHTLAVVAVVDWEHSPPPAEEEQGSVPTPHCTRPPINPSWPPGTPPRLADGFLPTLYRRPVLSGIRDPNPEKR